MPHDKRGDEIKVGDIVNVPCKVTGVHQTEEYCNVDLVTTEVMPPTEQPNRLTLNSRQVIKPR